MAPNGSFAVSANRLGQVMVHPLDGEPVIELKGFTDVISDVAVGARSRLVAAGSGGYNREEAIVRVWDMVSGTVRVLDAEDDRVIGRLEFTPDGDLWVLSWAEIGPVLRRWQLAKGQPRIVEEIDLSNAELDTGGLIDFNPKNRQLLFLNEGRVRIFDVDSRETRELNSHSDPNTIGYCGFDTGNDLVISNHMLGFARVGPTTGEEPHLLPGHEAIVQSAAVSPDGQWIATGDHNGTIRLWPMPDFSKPPLHSLPREELIAKLKTLTNLRAVRDPESSTGWDTEFGPFPGWETVPEW
jgi:WD40 repeat protein